MIVDNHTKVDSICLNTTGRLSNTDEEYGVCAEGFYLENSSHATQCIPLCDFWVSGSDSSADVGFIISMILSIISSVIVFIVALGPQRDTM